MYSTDRGNMNYKRIYDELMERGKTRTLTGYKEIHHIVPRYLNGSNDRENLVALTAREHYLAHWLWYKHKRDSKSVYAWRMMAIVGIGQQRCVNSRFYEYCRNNLKNHLSEDMAGSGNNFYGRKHTDDTKKKIRDAKTGKPLSLECRAKMSLTRKGVPKSKEHKAKIGRSGLVILWEDVYDNPNVLRVPKIDVLNYPNYIYASTWKRKYNPEEWKCPHCNKEGIGMTNAYRWHFDKCKHKHKEI